MVICRECGVELDDHTIVCPLCDTPLITEGTRVKAGIRKEELPKPKLAKKDLLQQVIWQVACVLLLSGVAATLVINLSIQGTVTWSIYPISICMILLSYTALVATWHVKASIQALAGWLMSSFILILVNSYVTSDWPLELALPILCSVNITGFLLGFVLKQLRVKGLNIIAVVFVAIAALCLTIEGIISAYLYKDISFEWSVIVAACLLPVTAAILFMHFRSRHNKDLQKIFHT